MDTKIAEASSEVIILQQGDVLTIQLNCPESANALKPSIVECLIQALSNTQHLRLCVIQGEGKNFCGGFDLSDIENLSDGDLLWRFLRIENLLQTIHYAPFATVAFAQGHVVGAGADLFAACWQRIASSDAKFRMPGWQFGLALGTRRLGNLIGRNNAREMLIDTKVVTADEALNIGLATDILCREEWLEKISAIKKRCESLPQSALSQMLEITSVDSRDADIASIVRTAGFPGLKQRILSYRERLAEAKELRDSAAQ